MQPGSRTEAPPERAGFRLACRWPSKPKEVPKAAAPKAAAPKVAGKAEHHHAGAAGAPKAAVPKAPTAEAKEGKGAGGAKEAKAGGQGGAAASKEAALSARTNPMRRDR